MIIFFQKNVHSETMFLQEKQSLYFTESISKKIKLSYTVKLESLFSVDDSPI